jgi:hypothetical protein
VPSHPWLPLAASMQRKSTPRRFDGGAFCGPQQGEEAGMEALRKSGRFGRGNSLSSQTQRLSFDSDGAVNVEQVYNLRRLAPSLARSL